MRIDRIVQTLRDIPYTTVAGGPHWFTVTITDDVELRVKFTDPPVVDIVKASPRVSRLISDFIKGWSPGMYFPTVCVAVKESLESE